MMNERDKLTKICFNDCKSCIVKEYKLDCFGIMILYEPMTDTDKQIINKCYDSYTCVSVNENDVMSLF